MNEPKASTEPEAVEAEGVVEPTEMEAAPAEAEEVPEEKDPITALQDEVAHWKDLALRSRADLDNYRKRISAEKSESIRYANQSLFESLLPVMDNFHFGLDAARTASDSAGVLMGMEMVHKQFEDFLLDQNINTVAADTGNPFDPNLHEAVAQEFDPEVPEGTILKVIRRGYKIGDRLVRAANVVVSNGPDPSGN